MNFSYSKIALACTLALSGNLAWAEGETVSASAPAAVAKQRESAPHAAAGTERLPENSLAAAPTDNPPAQTAANFSGSPYALCPRACG
ncbi:hypothetical protein [Eikenella sp. Marseille-P7795]|uniref:hypothetical protein n=1 Tax=Eikenella sp. Marseille-P7795 TaxID=2866577 RepID=UPI001CE41D69|nr:hypothetical protein [Eikenella sp. Marseille-P7795]